MRHACILLILVAVFSVAPPSRAEEPDLTKLVCPSSFKDGHVETYARTHDVPVVGDIKPMSTETDTLHVVGRDKAVFCFGLVTVARNFHQCGLMGVAKAQSPGTYLFEEGKSKIRFKVNAREIRVEPLDDGYKSHCGMYGEIEASNYQRKPAS